MVEPVRLQLSRRRGFNLQAWSREVNGLAAVNVARPSRFGNPFTVVAVKEFGYRGDAQAYVVHAFKQWLTTPAFGSWWSGTESANARALIHAGLASLRGKNLACFCKPGEPCHADVLLEIANANPVPPPVQGEGKS